MKHLHISEIGLQTIKSWVVTTEHHRIKIHCHLTLLLCRNKIILVYLKSFLTPHFVFHILDHFALPRWNHCAAPDMYYFSGVLVHLVWCWWGLGHVTTKQSILVYWVYWYIEYFKLKELERTTEARRPLWLSSTHLHWNRS